MSVWAMWMMMSGVQKIQPKSGNRVPAGFLQILDWCDKVLLTVKKETILAKIGQCFMTSELGPVFNVEPEPEAMKIDKKPGKKKKIVVVKSKTPEEMKRLAKKKDNKRKKLGREKRKKMRKVTPKKRPDKKSPRGRVVQRKALSKKKERWAADRLRDPQKLSHAVSSF